MTVERSEYLKRPLVEGVVYKISEEEVDIQCSHTSFIQIVSAGKPIDLFEIERLFKELRSAAKASGKVKLKGVTKFLPKVRRLYPLYLISYNKMVTLFAEIVELSKQLQADGIHSGFRDDELLDSITVRKWEIEKLHFHNTDYSKFCYLYNNLKRVMTERLWEQENIESCTIPLV